MFVELYVGLHSPNPLPFVQCEGDSKLVSESEIKETQRGADDSDKCRTGQ